jgi:hypothetical protein
MKQKQKNTKTSRKKLHYQIPITIICVGTIILKILTTSLLQWVKYGIYLSKFCPGSNYTTKIKILVSAELESNFEAVFKLNWFAQYLYHSGIGENRSPNIMST